MSGPLAGLRVIEIAGIGPGPFAAMMLADHGAEVIRVNRPNAVDQLTDPLLRSRKSVVLDLKSDDGRAKLKQLCKTCDALLEGFRPGVMERLGLGPDALLTENPALIYGRMTGWGQDGPYAQLAGHDINYISISGALASFGRAGEKPVPPINLIGDFGGGGMLLAFGMVSAMLAVKNGAPGQVVDCAMTDGSALLMAMMWGYRARGEWNDERGTNLLDTGAPFYEVYETSDGKFVSIGPIEPQFYAMLMAKLGLEGDPAFTDQNERSLWPQQRRRFTGLFLTRTRAEWCELLQATDSCFAPVLNLAECLGDPHNLARQTFVDVDGVIQPAPAPRYSATPCDFPLPPRHPGADQSIFD